MALFSEKDQLMYEGDKASFAQKCLKANVIPNVTKSQKIDSLVVDGGCLLRQTKWESSKTWSNILDG